MKLQDIQIKSITKGAVQIVQNGGWLCFFRFPQNVISSYGKISPDLYVRCHSSSGIRFDFFTNSENFSMSYQFIKGSSSNLGAIDVLVNGVICSHVVREVSDGKTESFSASLGQGEKRVTVYLPTLAGIKVSSVELDNGATLTPAPQSKTALFFGDSITQGYTSVFPSLNYVSRTARALDVDFYNFGIGSDVFNTAVLDSLPDFSPDIVFTAYGTNDWSKKSSVYSYKSSCSEYFERLCKIYPRARLVAILPIWRADCDRVTDVGTFDEAKWVLLEVLREHERIKVIDGDTLVPHVRELYADGYLHPNEVGFEFYAQNLVSEMSK